jgi:hypothetical protein
MEPNESNSPHATGQLIPALSSDSIPKHLFWKKEQEEKEEESK